MAGLIKNESAMTPGLTVIQREKKTKASEPQKVRVAAYCRVSTDLETQKSSMKIQMEAFQRIIDQYPGWELAGIYADRGLSGTSAAKRVEFQRMIADAEAGRIDYIIAKSTSRFARNTIDTLYYTRYLKDHGVGVYFEEQRLDTNSLASEILLTIHAAFAQEESHSISENMKKGVRSRFAMGIPKWSATYGLRRESGDHWVQNPDEAAIIRRIFLEYLEGRSLNTIAAGLEKDRTPAPGGKSRWYAYTIASILRNEKYIGDVAMQKTFTVDHITHRKVSNRGAKIPRYYKSDHHPAVVDKETFDLVQTILEMRCRRSGAEQYPYYGFLKCPYCGENMVRLRLPSHGHENAWTCGGHVNDMEPAMTRSERTQCPPFFVREKYIDRAFDDKKPEYVSLYKAVRYVTFAVCEDGPDWNTLVVESREDTVPVQIEYDKKTDWPTQLSLQLEDFCRNFRITEGLRVPIVEAPEAEDAHAGL